MKATTIAENCRSILRERYCNQRSCNHTGRLGTIPQQEYPPSTWKPCHPIPTNPIHSVYGVDNLRVPVVCCEVPSYCNTLSGLSPTIPSSNYIRHSNCIDRNTNPVQSVGSRQTGHIPCLSTPSDNCIQMITNSVISKVRCKIPQEEIALLCCCLPSLIRQIMCKSPWLTPNNIIQCLSADIIKESLNCFDPVDFNVKNDFRKPKQNYHSEERVPQQRNDQKFEDKHSVQSHEDDSDSLSSYQSATSAASEGSFLSQKSSRSVLDVPKNDKKKQKDETRESRSRTPSTRSFTSQQSRNLTPSSQHSAVSPSWSADNQSEQSDRNTPVHLDEDARSFTSHEKDSHLSVNFMDSNEDFDKKSVDLSPKSEPIQPSTRIHIDYPGKIDPNATRDVEKCLAFYQKIREYFDDDVAATLFKCCLCYGDCSGRK